MIKTSKYKSLISEEDIHDTKKDGKDIFDKIVEKMIPIEHTRKPDRIKEDILTIRVLNRHERITVKQMRDIRKAVDKFKSELSDMTNDELVEEYSKRRKKNKNAKHLDLLGMKKEHS